MFSLFKNWWRKRRTLKAQIAELREQNSCLQMQLKHLSSNTSRLSSSFSVQEERCLVTGSTVWRVCYTMPSETALEIFVDRYAEFILMSLEELKHDQCTPFEPNSPVRPKRLS